MQQAPAREGTVTSQGLTAGAQASRIATTSRPVIFGHGVIWSKSCMLSGSLTSQLENSVPGSKQSEALALSHWGFVWIHTAIRSCWNSVAGATKLLELLALLPPPLHSSGPVRRSCQPLHGWPVPLYSQRYLPALRRAPARAPLSSKARQPTG